MKPILLDTYCKAGGTTKGYQDAGFHVVGVDIEPQKNYCGDEFFQCDAIEFIRRFGKCFDAISSSPPCQKYTKSTEQWRKSGKEYPDLISETRKALIETGKPYVIENVPNAPLINPIFLNGAMFGLFVHRPRYFECSFHVPQPLMPIVPKPVKMGRPVKEGDYIQPVGHFSGVEYARKQMGIDWMTVHELAQAIPPKYTEYVGNWLMNWLPVSVSRVAYATGTMVTGSYT